VLTFAVVPGLGVSVDADVELSCEVLSSAVVLELVASAGVDVELS
jgi:hypothetical protein